MTANPTAGEHPTPTVGCESRRGKRPANQDRIFCQEGAPGLPLVIGLADGMGGHASGEVAAELAVAEVARMGDGLRARPQAELDAAIVASMLEATFHRAHDRIKEEAAKSDAIKAMGTTLAVAVIWDGNLSIAHTGDSRCYHVSSEAITQLTGDHTLVADLTRAGQMSEEEAANSPLQHLLSYALGHTLHVDIFPHAGETAQPTPPYDVVLSSDGVHGSVTAEMIHEELLRSVTPKEGCTRLIDLAHERGSTDNLSVVIARVTP